MKRDMDLMRTILLKIEEEFPAGKLLIHGIKVEGYDLATIAEHCQLLYQAGLISNYKPHVGGHQGVLFFQIGNLTNEGYDFLDKCREDTTWNEAKEIVKKRKLPAIINVFKEILSTLAEGATRAVIKEANGG